MTKYATRLDMIAALPSGSIGAEIGVHRGEFSAQMLGLPNVKFLYLIDPWRSFPRDIWTSDLNGQDQQANLDATRNALADKRFDGKFTLIHMMSDEAYHQSLILPQKLDFIFLDANHRFKFVLDDLTNWSKRTDVICGHDFCTSDLSRRHNWGVVEAVEEFLERNLDWHLEAVTLDDPPSFKMVRT